MDIQEFREQFFDYYERIGLTESDKSINDPLSDRCERYENYLRELVDLISSFLEYNRKFDCNLEIIIIAAFRYALTRESYMPSLVASFINKNRELLSKSTLKTIIQEIDEAKPKLKPTEYSIWAALSSQLFECFDV